MSSSGGRYITNINEGRSYPAPDDPGARPTHLYGDDFNLPTLAPQWTPRNLAAGTMTFPAADLFVRFNFDAQGDSIWRPAPSGDFEIITHHRINEFGAMVGPAIVDATGQGIAGSVYTDANVGYTWYLTSYIYNSTGVSVAAGTKPSGMAVWTSLRKTGNNYQTRFSHDGATWTAFSANHALAITVAQIGFGRFFTTGGTGVMVDLIRFNVYPGPGFYS